MLEAAAFDLGLTPAEVLLHVDVFSSDSVDCILFS